ncbi:sulfatase [Halonotius terrestris]|uniref:Sulfatase n=1 Tax=Halonotius terrestris TaxID=2487750 RepID=A0A8J8PF52_9EURY|nr:sulfatase [Halonotius terrestris]TQQ83537.1 sulfatase [Halonotius terrestris]
MNPPDVSNTVLITVDSLRPDAISPYAADRHTPALQSLADRGTVFENAFANGNWTPFSFPSILASRPVFADNGAIGVEDSETLASALSAEGVATGGFNAANGFLTAHWGYDDGFDEFEPFVASVGGGIYSRYLATHPTVEAWVQLATSPLRRARSWLNGDSDDRPFLDASRMFDIEETAIEFIEREDDFFLWIHYMDTHTPYVPAPRYIREVSDNVVGTHRMLRAHTRTGLGWEVGPQTLADLRMLYQATVSQVDASIGRVMDALSANGIDDDTAVIVAGDHGEEFQEHGHLAHYPKLYDELLNVPLIVDVPGTDARRVDRQVGLDAIPPTVTDLFGIDAPSSWRGQSLWPTVRDGTPPADEPVVSVTVRGESVTTQPIPRSLADGELLVSVRDQDWIYIEHTETGATELYYRPDDPTQQTDLSADPTPEAAAVIERFDEIAAAHVELITGESESASADAVDEDLEAQLTALGYK